LTTLAANDTFPNAIQIDETLGFIVGWDGSLIEISGEALTLDGYDELPLMLGDASIYDLLTGLPISVCDLKPGLEVRAAYHVPPGGLPQAVAVWVHPTHPRAAGFTVTVSGVVEYGIGFCTFLSQDGRYRVTLTDDTYIYDPVLGYLTPEDIEPGQQFFVWVDMITASSPALVYPDKVVIICP